MIWAVVVAKMAELLIRIPEDPSLNPNNSISTRKINFLLELKTFIDDKENRLA